MFSEEVYTQTHKCMHSQTDRHTCTHTHTHTDRQTHTHTHCWNASSIMRHSEFIVYKWPGKVEIFQNWKSLFQHTFPLFWFSLLLEWIFQHVSIILIHSLLFEWIFVFLLQRRIIGECCCVKDVQCQWLCWHWHFQFLWHNWPHHRHWYNNYCN